MTVGKPSRKTRLRQVDNPGFWIDHPSDGREVPMMTMILLPVVLMLLVPLFTLFPRVGAAAVILLATQEWLSIPTGSWNLNPGEVGGLAYVIATLLRSRFHVYERLKNPFAQWSLSLAVVFTMPALFSLQPGAALLQAGQVGLYALTALCLHDALRQPGQFEWAVRLLQGALLLLLLTGAGWLGSGYRTGGYGDESYFPLFIAVLLPFVAYELTQRKAPRQRIALYAAIVLPAAFAIGMKSRSGTVMILLTLLLLTTVDRQLQIRWRRLGGIIACLLSALAINLLVSEHPVRERLAHWLASPKLQERISNNLLCLRIFVEHPLLGVGAGQYPAYAEWLGVAMPHPITNRLSSLFQLPAETGLLGTVAWVGFLVTLIHYGYGYLREREEILPRFVWFSLVLLSLAALVYSIHEVLLSWCLLAVFSAITSEVPPPAEEIMQPLILQYKVERRIG